MARCCDKCNGTGVIDDADPALEELRRECRPSWFIDGDDGICQAGAAALTGLSERYLRQARSEGCCPLSSEKIDGRVVYRLSEIVHHRQRRR